MVFDLVGYYGAWPFWKSAGDTPEKLLGILNEFGIDRLAVGSTKAIFDDWEGGNREVVALTEEHPERFTPSLTFGVRSPVEGVPAASLKESLSAFRSSGHRLLGLFPQHQGYNLDDDEAVQEVLEHATRLGFILLIHIRTIMNWAMPVLPVVVAERLARRFPDSPVVLCGVNSEWAGAASALARCPNLYLETSCLQYQGMIEFFCARIGAERILFGSGSGLQYALCGLVKVQKAAISEAAKERILGGNACQLLEDPDSTPYSRH
jgi:uncharacterized protein